MITTFDSNYESDDSISEFERKLRVLLPDMNGRSDDVAVEKSRGTRNSERKKKPSSRLNEEAGFIAEPPRLSKKKVLPGNDEKNTSLKRSLLGLGER